MLSNLLHWNPADELRSIFDQFERRLGSWSRSSGAQSTPELASTDDRMTLRVPLPGMSREDVEITASGSMLRIRAARKEGEGSFAQYEQVLTLPESVDVNRASASMRNGLLELTLPYSESRQPQRIEIETDGPKQISAAA